MMASVEGVIGAPASTAPNFRREVLVAWMHHMESYGEVWYDDIGRDYFNQEYWYLLVIAMVRYWRDKADFVARENTSGKNDLTRKLDIRGAEE